MALFWTSDGWVEVSFTKPLDHVDPQQYEIDLEKFGLAAKLVSTNSDVSANMDAYVQGVYA